jgi:hypothetical protein
MTSTTAAQVAADAVTWAARHPDAYCVARVLEAITCLAGTVFIILLICVGCEKLATVSAQRRWPQRYRAWRRRVFVRRTALPALCPGQIWLTRDKRHRCKIEDTHGAPKQYMAHVENTCDTLSLASYHRVYVKDRVKDGYRIRRCEAHLDLITLLWDPHDPA